MYLCEYVLKLFHVLSETCLFSCSSDLFFYKKRKGNDKRVSDNKLLTPDVLIELLMV
jgi:hypothetical protein